MNPKPFKISGLAWLLAIAQTAVIMMWVALSDRISFHFSPPPVSQQIALAVLVSALALVFLFGQRLPLSIVERAKVVGLGLCFAVPAFTGIRILNHLTMTIPFPLADDPLAAWDRAIGLDWYAYASWIGQATAWHDVIRFTYSYTTQLTAFLFIGLALLGRSQHAKEFIELLFFGALFSVVVGAAFPAQAAMVHLADDHLRAMFGGPVGVYHLKDLELLRGTGPIVLGFNYIPGLVTFPSYHTIAGILVVYACRGSAWTFFAAVYLMGAMLLGTPVYGGHYFIDIIAGAVVAGLLIALAERPRLIRAINQLRNVSTAGLITTPEEPPRASP